MAEGGYIKLWRKLEQWLRERDATPAQKWTTVEMLLMANWKDEAGIPRGSFASSERDISERAGVSRKVVRATQAMLQQGDAEGPFLTVKRAHSRAHLSSIYTVENYNRWQGDDAEQGPPEGPPVVPPGPTSGSPRAHALYIKKLRSEEERESTPKQKRIRTTTPPEDLELLHHCERLLADKGRPVALPASKRNVAAVRAARHSRTQQQAMDLLTRYYQLGGDVEEAGWPLGWLADHIAALLKPQTARVDSAKEETRAWLDEYHSMARAKEGGDRG